VEKDGRNPHARANFPDDAGEETSMPSVSRRILVPFVSIVVVGLTLTGCTGRLIPSAGPQTVTLHMQGQVHGGQQPVSGASIQLFDITASANSSPAVPLIGSTILSDANGAFNITNDYICPNVSDQVYLAARGGDPGSGVNTDLVMLTALGNCGDLSSSTFIFVNEVTTVATVWAYANSFDVDQTLGANINHINGGEIGNFRALVDPTSGVALTTFGTDVQLRLNALANSLSTCVNSATDVNGDSPQCDQLVTLGGGPDSQTTDSAEAVFAIDVTTAFDTNADTSGVYNFAPASPPFEPTLTSAPQNWYLGFTSYEGCARHGVARVRGKTVLPRC
jgi:hypothetical protein